jgi:hypothetical protein
VASDLKASYGSSRPDTAVRLDAMVLVRVRAASALLCGLAGDTEPGADLGPGEASGSEAVDGLLDGVVDIVGQVDQVCERFDIPGCYAAAVYDSRTSL